MFLSDKAFSKDCKSGWVTELNQNTEALTSPNVMFYDNNIPREPETCIATITHFPHWT